MAAGARKPEGLFLIPGCGSRLKSALLFLHDDLTLGPAEVLEPLTECGGESLPIPVALGRRHRRADASHPVGRRPADRERPARRRAAGRRAVGKGDDAPLHVPPREHALRSQSLPRCERAAREKWYATGLGG